MSGDDRNEQLELFLQLLDTLAEIEDLNERRHGENDRAGDEPAFGYDIAMGRGGPSKPDATAWLVTTRQTADGLLVVADLPRTEPGAVEVDIDRVASTLRFRIDGRTVERVALPDPAVTVAERAARNGVLEVRLD